MAKTPEELELKITAGLVLRPGDTLLVTFPRLLSEHEVAGIKTKIMGLIPGLGDVVVFGAGATLAAYRPEPEDS